MESHERLLQLPPAAVQTVTSASRWAVTCVMLTELFERAAFFGISDNLQIFCELKCFPDKYHDPLTFTWIFSGFAYAMNIFGGWLADTALRRFTAILSSLLIYTAGTLFLVGSAQACDNTSRVDNTVPALYVTGLCLVVLGTAGSQSNLGLYGAEQFRDTGDESEQERKVHRYFLWYYWCRNFGSVVAYTLVTYFLYQTDHHVYGYAAISAAVTLAAIFFATGYKRYRQEPQKEQLFKILIGIVSNRTDTTQPNRNVSSNREVSYSSSVDNSTQDRDVLRWLDRAKRSKGGRYPDEEVDDIKQLLSILGIFLTMLVYFTLYCQISTTYRIQSRYLRLPVLDKDDFFFSTIIVSLINPVSILLMVPLMDLVVYPCLSKIGWRPTYLQRIGAGMFLSMLSVTAAGVLEVYRGEVHQHHVHPQNISGQVYNATDLSVFMQVPQFFLSGVSEIMAVVTGFHFAYTQAPRRMKGTVMGLFLLMFGLGSYLSIGISSAFNITVEGIDSPSGLNINLNNSHAERFHFFLAGLMFLDMGLFWLLARRYKYKTYLTKAKDFERSTSCSSPRDYGSTSQIFSSIQ
ncbi:solute carrier family 15 member 4-like [Branchiostoma floridae]|uniref:Solute carrier family 15 member 4-like n=1 Tax=Branchiostoma floridae TaxID=7739 RepID=A0A9J7KTY4_BRAFL|nr:solute carrier family 15 member 4-like [Branchiostoma floridae]